ncbi:MAG: apolipoprotein N-acyltransferase [Microthrixaceae bacterium]
MERRGVPTLLALVAGLCLCASLPPWGWWPLAFVGIALWLHLLDGRGARGRFGLSWVVGVAWFTPSTLWMFGLTPPGYIAGALIGWGPMVGLVGVAATRTRWRLLALPASIVVFEWFHSHAPFGGVPLSLLSMGQARAPMLPIARLGGSLLVSAAVAAVGVALYAAVAWRRWIEPVAVLGGVAVLVAAGAASTAFVHTVEEPDGSPATMRIAAVQGGGPQGTRYTSDEVPRVFQRHLDATRTITGDVDLVIWPENAINVAGPFESDPWKDEIAIEARRLDAPIVVGVVEDDPDHPDQFLNYVTVVQPDGSLVDRYDKERRVPFGEYVPMRWLFEPFARDTLPPRDATPGVGSAMVDTPAGPTAVAISWEIFFARRVREGVRDGGEVVLNPTNGSSYWLTQVQSQQLATSAFRAVESGRWVVQVAPTGFSAEFDEHGSLLQRVDVGERRILYADVPRLTGTTPAQLLGDLPAMLLAVLALAATAVAVRSGRAASDPDTAVSDTAVSDTAVSDDVG